jgi:ABC-type glutathione transport system ATPase component
MPHELSGGEQQRVVIARALLNNPQVILADEPTGNLDAHTGKEIMQLIYQVVESGTSVVMATHNMRWVSMFPGRVLHCVEGRLSEIPASQLENFTLDEYLRMEEYERHTLSHYPFKDEARRDMVRKLAKLSAIADHCMMQGDNKEATTVLQSYNTLIKELGISTETSNEADSIDTLSELVAYLEKTGFLLNYKISENRDIVDKTITNYEQYVKRLFMDSNETVQEMYNSAKMQEEGGTEITDDDIDNLYQLEAEEADIDLGAPMHEKDLETMFSQLENEYK